MADVLWSDACHGLVVKLAARLSSDGAHLSIIKVHSNRANSVVSSADLFHLREWD